MARHSWGWIAPLAAAACVSERTRAYSFLRVRAYAYLSTFFQTLTSTTRTTKDIFMFYNAPSCWRRAGRKMSSWELQSRRACELRRRVA